MSRFDYIKYDEISIKQQKDAKKLCEDLEFFVNYNFQLSRQQSLALTKLEECYMWIGKIIRDQQIERNNIIFSQEGRSDS